jgi:hypothetical protein
MLIAHALDGDIAADLAFGLVADHIADILPSGVDGNDTGNGFFGKGQTGIVQV